MKKMEISVSDEAAAFISKQLGSGAYGSVDEYIEALICADQYDANEETERLLIEGLATESNVMTRDDWDGIRAQVLSKSSEIPE
ncbi:type II toxin-antitoxin system ParD family antitoxin [Massilia sp. BJB1822]|uniref:ribbon-helix-helix domain-containing protein n=1 Tax=Massilia sp. BJB1822 TaxID=2744470 RepID=UPI0015947B00|nr:type II toxin-antitoxin system ParD family antitoxin [Massilia sp. BJB1822]NVD99031.1 type II toxin-antitoxin system ParD family antitoxin [Massilia sp. BJB1822]